MSIPKHDSNAGIHVLTWATDGVVIRVDHIRENSQSTVTGEVTIQTTSPSTAPHLHQARLNLLSTTSRNTLISQLKKRFDLPPWDDIIEQLCVMVIQKHREGEPVVNLAELAPAERVFYRVRPIIQEKQANLIYGAGGSGKSTLALYLAALVNAPLNANGLETEPGEVLYLDYETSAEEIRERLASLSEGLGLAPVNVHYRFCAQPLADDIEEIQRLVIENGYSMVVVDSLGSACGGEPEKAEPCLNYYRALRSLRTTTLTVHHENREGKFYGNVYIWNQSRSIWELSKSQEEDEGSFAIALYHRKVNSGRLLAPLSYRLAFDGPVTRFHRQDIRDVAELVKKGSARTQIEAALKHGALSVAEIIEITEIRDNTVVQTLHRNEPHTFLRLPSGKWALPSPTTI